jgi:leucyl aminopeptidase
MFLMLCSIKAMDQAWAEGLGMGAFLSVARGSYEPLKFLEMKYNGGEKLSILMLATTLKRDSVMR